MTIIGNSGFEYTSTGRKLVGGHKRSGYKYAHTVTVKSIKTKEVIFTIKGGVNFTPYSSPYTGERKFLGHDNKYYLVVAKSNYTVDWGQIQSDGAVLRPDRTILTVLAFFPNYEKSKTNIPVKTPIVIIKPPNIPKIVTVPRTVLSTKTAIPVIPDTPPVKDKISWIQKIIKKIIDWMKKILNP